MDNCQVVHILGNGAGDAPRPPAIGGRRVRDAEGCAGSSGMHAPHVFHTRRMYAQARGISLAGRTWPPHPAVQRLA